MGTVGIIYGPIKNVFYNPHIRFIRNMIMVNIQLFTNGY